MRVISHDPAHPVPVQKPHPSGITFAPFRTVKLSRGRELRIAIATGPNRRSVSARLFRMQRGRPENLVSEPVFLFPEQIAELITTLNEAGDAMATMPPIAPVTTETE